MSRTVCELENLDPYTINDSRVSSLSSGLQLSRETHCILPLIRSTEAATSLAQESTTDNKLVRACLGVKEGSGRLGRILQYLNLPNPTL